jgi:hypothetical protein
MPTPLLRSPLSPDQLGPKMPGQVSGTKLGSASQAHIVHEGVPITLADIRALAASRLLTKFDCDASGIRELPLANDPSLVKEYFESDSDILGTYSPMKSLGAITLYLDRIAICHQFLLKHLGSLKFDITCASAFVLAEVCIQLVLIHEQFHHFSDVMRRISRRKCDALEEEALAEAWAWSQAWSEFSPERIDPRILRGSICWWYGWERSPGYRRWPLYVHRHFFEDALVKHIIDSKTARLLPEAGCRLGSHFVGAIANADWLVPSATVTLSDKGWSEKYLPVSSGMNSSTTWPEYGTYPIDLRPSTCIDLSIEGNVHLCGSGLASLEGIAQRFKRVSGKICVDGAPIKSHVLGLLRIDGLCGVVGGGLWGEIINKHLQAHDLFDCQEELIEAGLDSFAKL